MKLRITFFSFYSVALLSAMVCPLASPALAQVITLSADTFARYQSGPLDDPPPTVVINPGFNVPVVSSALSDPASDGFSFAQGDASVRINSLGGVAGAFSYASGFNPNFGPPDDVHAAASAHSLVDWTSTSATLPANTPIALKIILPVEGTLAAAQFFAGGLGASDVFASASAELKVDGVSIYDGSALVYDPGGGTGDEVLVESGDWVGDFAGVNIPTTGFGPLPGFGINTLDIVTIPSTLGDVFTIDFLINTEAFTLGPFEAITQADFISTISYQLEAVDPVSGNPLDVQFIPVVVPEPSSLGMVSLALACLVVQRQRRRQAT